MDRGARRFAFLSRSGTDSTQAAILVEDIEKAGATVQVIRGDATSKVDVDRALKSIPADYPIRGVVNAAMVLRVSKVPSLSDHYLTFALGWAFPFHVVRELGNIHSAQGSRQHQPS